MIGIKSIIILSLVLFIASSALGQKNVTNRKSKNLPPNLPDFYDYKFHFGFSLGYNRSRFKMKTKSNSTYYDGVRSLNSAEAPAFEIIPIFDYHFSPNLSLRFTPSFSMQERSLLYTFETGGNSIERRVESSYLDLPLSFKFSINRIQNFSTYFSLGAKFSTDFASNADVNNSTNALANVVIKTKKYDYSYIIGGGFDFFLHYFKLGIDLKSSFGIPNILIQDNTLFSSPIESLKTRSFLITLTFEGPSFKKR